ncbi:hypothetical protein [Gilliamella sp. Nev3-1]|uniref:hypothetical protein n=1 Tax=Gilliamella sp. Nev3-1 TaxID=3120250 RepID=UPI00080E08D5|nr:hypothetical protein [Gilliamella apicola]OCG61221.1 hypothetical protein A9G40_01945 [Gilliamella apicola]
MKTIKYIIVAILCLSNFVFANYFYRIEIRTNGKYKEEYYYNYNNDFAGNATLYINNITNHPKLLTENEDDAESDDNLSADKRLASLPKTELESELQFGCFSDSELDIFEKKSKEIEFLQHKTTKDYYFKIVLSIKGCAYKMVGINVYRKKDGSLLQTINDAAISDYEFMSIETIKNGDSTVIHRPEGTDDYNFDGIDNDFFISKTTDDVMGVPTFHRFYSFDKNKGKFVYLNLEGLDISFDEKKQQAIQKKICPIKEDNDIVITKTFQFDTKKHSYTLLNSVCNYKRRSTNDSDKVFSRQCTQKEDNYCKNADELDDDFGF